MSDFVMPSLGASMESGVLAAWRKQAGEHVARGEIIAEVETDKGIIEVEAFHAGVVERWLVPEGTQVTVGTVLAVLSDEPEPAAAAAPRPVPPGASKPEAAATPAPRPEQPGERVRASPSARRLARELGVDVARVVGSGSGGAITREDVERASPGGTAAESDRAAARMRRAVAAAVTLSKREIPHYYLTHTLDMTPALAWLEELNATREVTERVLSSALLLAAVARSLRDFPELNGHWRDERFVPSDRIHVGMAISLRAGGLVAPAIHDADRLGLGELMTRLKDASERARTGALRSSELTDGTITLTNLGDRGVESVLGVIYPPQVALVGFGRILERPWVVGGLVVPRSILHVTLSADHRASDGHRGGLFLARLEKLLSEPASMVGEPKAPP